MAAPPKTENSLSDLLQAEEKANKIIREAEEIREKMREDAQLRAKEEIEQLRKQMEADYQARRAAQDQSSEALRDKSQSALELHQSEFEANKSGVIEMMVQRIMHVRYELPRNVKADFSHLSAHTEAK